MYAKNSLADPQVSRIVNLLLYRNAVELPAGYLWRVTGGTGANGLSLEIRRSRRFSPLTVRVLRAAVLNRTNSNPATDIFRTADFLVTRLYDQTGLTPTPPVVLEAVVTA